MDTVQPFSVESSIVARHFILTPASGWPIWSAFFVGAAMTAAGCVYDERLIMLGLMVILAIVPSITALIYFSHTLSPSIVANLLPHTLHRISEGYVVRIFHRELPMEESEEGETWLESGKITLLDKDIVARKTQIKYEMIFFKDSPMKILYVPRF